MTSPPQEGLLPALPLVLEDRHSVDYPQLMMSPLPLSPSSSSSSRCCYLDSMVSGLCPAPVSEAIAKSILATANPHSGHPLAQNSTAWIHEAKRRTQRLIETETFHEAVRTLRRYRWQWVKRQLLQHPLLGKSLDSSGDQRNTSGGGEEEDLKHRKENDEPRYTCSDLKNDAAAQSFYDVVWTSGTTAALKMVGEAFHHLSSSSSSSRSSLNEEEESSLPHAMEEWAGLWMHEFCHNSALGIREYLPDNKNASPPSSSASSPYASGDTMFHVFTGVATLQQKLQRLVLLDCEGVTTSNHLMVLPAECNATGYRPPLQDLIRSARTALLHRTGDYSPPQRLFVLVDAAAAFGKYDFLTSCVIPTTSVNISDCITEKQFSGSHTQSHESPAISRCRSVDEAWWTDLWNKELALLLERDEPAAAGTIPCKGLSAAVLAYLEKDVVSEDLLPEYIAVSYYKLLGTPTGLGALLVKKRSSPFLTITKRCSESSGADSRKSPEGRLVLSVSFSPAALLLLRTKRYFGGGTVNRNLAFQRGSQQWVADPEGVTDSATSLAQTLEDGTVHFQGAVAVVEALRHFDALVRVAVDRCGRQRTAQPLPSRPHGWGGTEFTPFIVSSYLSMLRENAKQKLIALCYAHNRRPLVHFYEDHDPSRQGCSILSFNVLQSSGAVLSYSLVEQLLRAQGVYVRSGCFCNPGACSFFLHYGHADNRSATQGLSVESLATSLANAEGGALHCLLPHQQAAVDHRQLGHVCGDSSFDLLADGRPTGMVRLSFGLHNVPADVDDLVEAFRRLFLVEVTGLPTSTTMPSAVECGAPLRIREMVLFPLKGAEGIHVQSQWPCLVRTSHVSADNATHGGSPTPHPSGAHEVVTQASLWLDREWALLANDSEAVLTPKTCHALVSRLRLRVEMKESGIGYLVIRKASNQQLQEEVEDIAAQARRWRERLCASSSFSTPRREGVCDGNVLHHAAAVLLTPFECLIPLHYDAIDSVCEIIPTNNGSRNDVSASATYGSLEGGSFDEEVGSGYEIQTHRISDDDREQQADDPQSAGCVRGVKRIVGCYRYPNAVNQWFSTVLDQPVHLLRSPPMCFRTAATAPISSRGKNIKHSSPDSKSSSMENHNAKRQKKTESTGAAFTNTGSFLVMHEQSHQMVQRRVAAMTRSSTTSHASVSIHSYRANIILSGGGEGSLHSGLEESRQSPVSRCASGFCAAGETNLARSSSLSPKGSSSAAGRWIPSPFMENQWTALRLPVARITAIAGAGLAGRSHNRLPADRRVAETVLLCLGASGPCARCSQVGVDAKTAVVRSQPLAAIVSLCQEHYEAQLQQEEEQRRLKREAEDGSSTDVSQDPQQRPVPQFGVVFGQMFNALSFTTALISSAANKEEQQEAIHTAPEALSPRHPTDVRSPAEESVTPLRSPLPTESPSSSRSVLFRQWVRPSAMLIRRWLVETLVPLFTCHPSWLLQRLRGKRQHDVASLQPCRSPLFDASTREEQDPKVVAITEVMLAQLLNRLVVEASVSHKKHDAGDEEVGWHVASISIGTQAVASLGHQ